MRQLLPKVKLLDVLVLMWRQYGTVNSEMKEFYLDIFAKRRENVKKRIEEQFVIDTAE